jgi:lycopene beta-cyclase
VAASGWELVAVKREEQGVLPIVLSGDIDAFWEEAPPDVPRAGMRAALFNPITGYSLPDAVRLADALCEARDWDSRSLYRAIRERSIAAWRGNRFARLLNRMLFEAAEPTARYRVLERFYRLPAPLIERFYAGRLTLLDRARLVIGAPPVPVRRALPCLPGDGRTAGPKAPLAPARGGRDAG